MRLRVSVAVGMAASMVVMAGCGSDSDEAEGSGSDTLKVVYQKFGNFTQADEHFTQVKEDFEAEHDGVTVELVPIEAAQNDYFTKLALMHGSESTAPDVMYEDTFMIKSDVDAGYLLPLDDYLAEWDDWDQFYDNAKNAGVGDDGSTYGVPMGTDTRALWYNTELFEQAGISVPWEPQSWDDVLDTARTIQQELPDVIPLNVYSGKAMGEASSMQGFEMLLYGTEDRLYDEESQSWITGSQGFVDSLGFIQTIFDEGLAPSPQEALDPNLGNTVTGQWLPEGRLAIALDGSWQGGNWMESGEAPWPEWNDVMANAAMPTQNGQDPGAVSMSGGWTLAVGAGSKAPDLAFEFITMALDQENSRSYDVEASQIAVREDVAEDSEYIDANPSFEFFSEIVEFTHFRPATSDYPQISNEIQVAMESVMTGQQSPEEAAAAYDSAVERIVGADAVMSAG
ncbi:extracellular solute-binding protein [Phytoactinopolyspora endophytica]|uniref:extracellular solute-binding protein n=1 Tax=Phytoactinopolyspora endophytica TaxID=1642495 RepID=UPI00101CB2E3|nr:extracellular solute-binding protein [Phytoactinopolyspora endophytica]